MRKLFGVLLSAGLAFMGTAASATSMPHGLIALTSLVCTCGTPMGIRSSVGTILVESGGHPWAIGDNDGKRSYYFATMAEAVQAAEGLMNAGHTNLDIGLSQINTQHFAAYGLTVETAFVPCTNVNTGMSILWKSFTASRAKYGSEAAALAASFTAYNSGHFAVGSTYSHNVWDMASALPPTLTEADCKHSVQVAHKPKASTYHVVASVRRRGVPQ
jgi:type IV secretion system protein VirB1